MTTPLPDPIAFMSRVVATSGQPLSEFRFRAEADWPRTLDYWLGSDRWRSSGHRFSLLAVDGTGGLYCLWHVPKCDRPEPPVVFLGSEGEGVGVIAGNAWDLLRLVATGLTYFGHDGSYMVMDPDELSGDEFLAFADSVRSVAGTGDISAEQILAEARRDWPGFAAWVATQTD